MTVKNVSGNCYDFPQYWDLAFRDETRLEADFLELAAAKYGRSQTVDILEPGCGGGRLVMELARRGYQVTGYDLSASSIAYLNRRIRRSKLANARAVVGDMVNFHVAQKFDLAINTVNTFRHLLTEDDAQAHLRETAKRIRPGGIYILGMHLLPPDADEEDEERWSARHGSLRVHMTLRVVNFNRRRRIERLRFVLRVRSPANDLRITSEYDYRIYTAAQMKALLKSVPEWELCDTFDFLYDIEEPLRLNNELGDAVFVLRKRTKS